MRRRNPGIAGIAGNGQAELMAALSGETLAGRPETVLLDGVPAGHTGPREHRKLGACFVPEDRHGHGAVPALSLANNAFLSAHARRGLARFGLVRRARTSAYADTIIAGFDVRTTGAAAEARSLSGGNLQKFLVGREVMLDPSVLVVDQPPWGVDAAAAAAIHAALAARARAGAGGASDLAGSGRTACAVPPDRGDRLRHPLTAAPRRRAHPGAGGAPHGRPRRARGC